MHQYHSKGLCLSLSASHLSLCGAYLVWCLILQLSSPLSGLPGESLAAVAAGDAALLSEAPVTITTEKSGEMSLTNVKDTGVDATNNLVS